MKRPFAFPRAVRWASALCFLTLLLSACAIEGGVPPATPVVTAPTLGPAPTNAAVAAVQETRDDTWVVGLLDRPQTLYPYQPSPTAQRIAAPITSLLFPEPILSYNYGYTSTQVLERIPTLDNGDAEIKKQDVFLDATGAITTTATDVITQVDQLVVTFHWNPKLMWSDGTPVTADDSVFAYDVAKASPPNDDARDRLSQLVAYERVDDHTTRATLRPDFTSATYFLNYWTPLPRHLLQNVDPGTIASSDFARRPIGYGPYQLEGATERTIEMTRNPYYFGEPAKLSRATFTFEPNADVMRAGMLNGHIDVAITDRPAPDLLPQLTKDEKQKKLAAIYLPNPIWEHIDMNVDVPVLQDVRVRRAIAMGTNRQAMVDALFSGNSVVLDSWIMPHQDEAAPPDKITRYEYNIHEARHQLDEAGFLDPGDGIRVDSNGNQLSLTLLTTDSPPLREEVANMFKANMREIGVEINVEVLPSSELFSPDGPLFQRQFDLALFGWLAGSDPGGLLLWSCAAVPSADNGFTGDNFSGWCSRDANRAIREAITSVDPQQRKDAYVRQQQAWTQDVPSLPLFQRLSVVVLALDVRGPLPDALAPITWNMATWDRAT